MSYKHVVAWLDHEQAHIIHFTADAAENEIVRTHSSHSHSNIKSGRSSNAASAEQNRYFEDIAAALKGSLEILIVGPGFEKLSLIKHLQKHEPELAKNVVSLETVDHPSDGQLLSFARKYFVKADLFL